MDENDQVTMMASHYRCLKKDRAFVRGRQADLRSDLLEIYVQDAVEDTTDNLWLVVSQAPVSKVVRTTRMLTLPQNVAII